MAEKKQGTQANLNGKVVEQMLEPIFKNNGFEVFDFATVSKKTTLIEDVEKYILRSVPFKTVYNSDGRTEFVIVDKTTKRRIRVESKYQAAAGSVDEKYPYMFLNAVYQYPENEVIFIVDGDGYKPGARQWLQDSIDSNWLDYKGRGKSIRLMKISEFINWFNHEF